MNVRAWTHRGKRQFVDGVPFGSTIEDGQPYVSSRVLWPDDSPMLAVDDVERIVRECTPSHFTRDYRPTDQLRDEICAAIREATG